MLDYWPLFVLGALCAAMAIRAWFVMTAPEPDDPRLDWEEWEAVQARKTGGK